MENFENPVPVAFAHGGATNPVPLLSRSRGGGTNPKPLHQHPLACNRVHTQPFEGQFVAGLIAVS